MVNNIVLNSIRYKCLTDFFKNISGIKYAIVKGEVLSLFAYGNFGQRIYNDIDILISKENYYKIALELKNLGFTQGEISMSERAFYKYTHQSKPFEKDYMGVNVIVDVNTDIFWGEFEDCRINIEEFLEESIYVDIFGTLIKTLSLEKTLIHLVLHGYKDYNSIYLLWRNRQLNHNILNDIYRMVVNNKLNIEYVVNFAKKNKLEKYFFVMFSYTYELFKDNRIEDLLDMFCSEDGKELLLKYGLCDSERKEWEVSLNTRLYCKDLRMILKNKLSKNDTKKIMLNSTFLR